METVPNPLKEEAPLITIATEEKGHQIRPPSNPRLDRQLSDLVGVFTDPIIVMPGGWGETLPGWIKEAITLERLLENIKPLQGEEPTATDAEATAYLYTASLEAPMDGDWTQIYLYLANKVIAQHQKTEVPADIKVESLSHYQNNELRRLKEWIYETRTRVRREKDLSERREHKEQDRPEKEALQPKMFDF